MAPHSELGAGVRVSVTAAPLKPAAPALMGLSSKQVVQELLLIIGVESRMPAASQSKLR